MTIWQRRARFLIFAAASAFAVVVALRIRGGPPARTVAPVLRSDPKAIIETMKFHYRQTNRDHEEVDIRGGKYLGYDDGSGKLVEGVQVVTERAGGRTFTITSSQALVDKDKTSFTFIGNVEVSSSDGMVVRTDRGTYTEAEGVMKAAGPVTFTQGRMSGTGVGVIYDKSRDMLKILDQVETRMEPGAENAERLDVRSGSAEFARPQHSILFERSMTATRDFETMEADQAVAHLSADEQRLDKLDLRGNSRVNGSRSGPGALKQVAGRDIDLTYSADGRFMQDAAVRGGSVIELSAEPGQVGSQIRASTIDVSLGADGSVLTHLAARESVQLTVPVAAGEPARTVTADAMNAQQGLTNARFTGHVEFREKGKDVSRTARAGILEVTAAAGLATIEDAQFSQDVQFEADTVKVTSAAASYRLKAGILEFSKSVTFKTDSVTATSEAALHDLKAETVQFAQSVKFETDSVTATAARALYVVKTETLELRESTNRPAPRVWNDRISIDARRLDVTIDGPKVVASGGVQSRLFPVKRKPGTTASGASDPKVPSMLKQDKDVQVTANELTYDGAASKATYTGSVVLWQEETKIKGTKLVIDDKTGDLTATGEVTTTSMLMQKGKDGTKSRVRSAGSAKDFRYEESERRATYTGNARLTDPQGDLSARKIELYLKASGDELDRAEAHEQVTLVESGRKTTGDELKYFSDGERYQLTGKPIHLEEPCRESVMLTLKMFRGNRKTIATGGPQNPTETRSDGSSCP